MPSVVVFGFCAYIASDTGTSTPVQGSTALSPTAAEEVQLSPDEILAAKWRYNEESDPMSSRIIRTAAISSENTVEFEFPYGGPQRGSLLLRDHPSYGRDVIFGIERGQLLCSSYEDCLIRVRFDDGPAEQFSARGPSDNSSTALFIQNYNRFLQGLRNAEVVRVQPEIYQQGAPVFEFQVGGYDHARYTGSPSGG